MFFHNLKLFIRNIKKYPGTFLINIIGLTTGLVCVLLIYLWVQDEFRVDNFHEEGDRLYQLMNNLDLPNGINTTEFTPSLLADDLAEKLPEVEQATHISMPSMRPNGTITKGSNQINAQGVFAHTNFFEVFSFPLIFGQKEQILKDKNGVLISEKLATTLFPSISDAMGQSIKWKTLYFDTNFTISGVFEDIPSHSTLQFDAVLPYEDWLIANDPDVAVWSDGYAETYLLLKEGIDLDKFETKIKDYLRSKGEFWKISSLFPKKYSSKYLHGSYENGVLVGGRIEYVKYFSAFALFILIIACINFMNLSTAQATRKFKEIGIKKAMGISRGSLIQQYLLESIFLTFLSLLLAGMLTQALLPGFSTLTGKQLQFSFDMDTGLSILAILLLTGVIAGSYPALYLSGFRPQSVLKGELDASHGGLWVRKGLVIFQFSLSVIFIAGIFVINRQMNYTQTKNLGYSREHILSFQRPVTTNNSAAFLSELEKIPGVLSTSNMVGNILSNYSTQNGYSWRGVDADEEITFKAPMLGYGAIETLGMELLQGRSFSKEYGDDPSKIIINESARKMMGLTDPIGMVISKDVWKAKENREIIGVVKDFHYGSIHHPIEPLILRFREGGQTQLAKLKPGLEKQILEKTELLFKKFYPNQVFKFSFLDADYMALYEAESRVALLSKYFAILSIIISCLGLFGLAIFTTERRKREISIRKVLGQSTAQVSLLLSHEFAKLVLLAICAGLPIAYFIAQKWLSNFAYRIDLNPGYFAFAGLLVLMIALLTVSSQALRAARRSPIEALREE